MDIIQAERWAVKKMAQHGLIQEGWTFDFDSSRHSIGLCYYREKRITVSLHYTKLNDESLFEDTVLHEIAHALAGPEAGHGPKWKAKCIEIGAKPLRLQPIQGIVLPTKKYVAECPRCKYLHYKARLPKKRLACLACHPIWTEERVLHWTINSEHKK